MTMLIGGQDRGQLRFGLMSQRDEMVIAVPAAPQPVEEADVVQAAFVPEKPVMVQPLEVTQPVAPVVEVAAESTGKIMRVSANSANVREGPGKDHAVIGRLTQGEEVLVVVEGETAAGWSLVRIEGDGVEGYVATRLLTE